MQRYDYDLFVIGAGSGGVRASRMASQYGARVAIAEESRVGGTCVIRGCVPKKLLVYGTHFSEDFEDAGGYGWQAPSGQLHWRELIAAKDREIDRLNGIYLRNLERAGVTLYPERAVLEDAHTVAVGGRRVTAETVLVATGSWPSLPDIPGIGHAITSNEALHLDRLPERIVIVGGGYIALEFAGIFNAAGAQVTQLYRGSQILRGFDDDVRDTVAEEVRKKGVDLRVDANVTRIDKTETGLSLQLTDGSTMDTDCLMYATGRAPNTAHMGLAEAGVELGRKGEVQVDAYSRSSAENIFAIGDVTDRVNLTPVAIHEAMAFADYLYGGRDTKPDHDKVPCAIFSQPPAAAVGWSERVARERLGAVDIYRTSFKPMKHTLSGRDERAMMKLVVDRETDVVVGAHMVGADAAEIIQGVAIAVKAGATKAQFDATVAIHPTTAEEFVTMREPVG